MCVFIKKPFVILYFNPNFVGMTDAGRKGTCKDTHNLSRIPFIIEIYFLDNVLLSANQCTEEDELFNSTASAFPGANIILSCSLFDTTVRWNSSRFAMPLQLDYTHMSAVESGIAFQLHTVSTSPLCSNATATITNFQESMDGLDLTCYNPLPQGFTSTVFLALICKWACVTVSGHVAST